MKFKVDYIWLDGYEPEPNLRSKIKIIEFDNINQITLDSIPIWGFDGSSTKQAEGDSSDCFLKPVRLYIPEYDDIIIVLCEVYDKDGNPHSTNQRAKLGQEDEDIWFGFEQEYFIREKHRGDIIGFGSDGNFAPPKPIDPQGIYYCGIGGQMKGRKIPIKHIDDCIDYGINIEGINAEVAIGQWEYQIFAKGKLKAGDDLWVSRYLLLRLAEYDGSQIDFHPKPISKYAGHWNGSGLHTNFSNDLMRNTGGKDYFMKIFDVFEKNMQEHINNYGSDNDLRLTGQYETQAIDKFSWGISDRGASIRVPKVVGETWKGYLEDRRPGSNADPYKIIKVIVNSLNKINLW